MLRKDFGKEYKEWLDLLRAKDVTREFRMRRYGLGSYEREDEEFIPRIGEDRK